MGILIRQEGRPDGMVWIIQVREKWDVELHDFKEMMPMLNLMRLPFEVLYKTITTHDRINLVYLNELTLKFDNSKIELDDYHLCREALDFLIRWKKKFVK